MQEITEKNYMFDLFKEFLKIVNCECCIKEDKVIINDLLYKPILNIGGFKFTFDENDVEMNSLLGGDGTELEIPFEFNTNDDLRKVTCTSLGDEWSFGVDSKKLDSKGNRLESIKLNASKSKIEIVINDSRGSIQFDFKTNRRHTMTCKLTFLWDDNFIDTFARTNKNTSIKYEITGNFSRKYITEKIVSMGNIQIDRLDNDLSHSTSAYVDAEVYSKKGYFRAQHKGTQINKSNELLHDQVDLYFEDVCSNTKPFVDMFRVELKELSPSLLDILLKNYPDFKILLDIIDNSKNNGIISNMFTDYFSKRKMLKNENSNNFIDLN